MSGWQLAAIVLLVGLLPCLLVAIRAGVRDALAALELAGTLTATALMILAQAYARQSFIDLALVLALLSNLGALACARMIEGER